MTRVGKYMVYNPRKDKPVKYYNSLWQALVSASELNNKEKNDILILKVVANCENETFKIVKNEHIAKRRRLEIVEE